MVQSQGAAMGPGTVLGGDFKVERPLGAGGMGSVYVAQQLSTGKPRAVKVMHPSLVTSPDMRERFVQEARIGSLIASDHVVEVVGAGVDTDTGVPWLAMELLNGEDLTQYVARCGRLSAEDLARVMRPVFHALSAAHQQGIVHRDIKPDNIFLATAQSTTAAMKVKVLDFGIAKVAAQALDAGTSAMGTPLWMAPEQTEQQAHVSPATDVWALGLVVFWCLTGRNFWRTAQTGTGSVPQLMREVLFEPMGPASTRAQELAPGLALPPGFDAWFARCTARDPKQRYADASAAGVQLFTNVLGVSSSTTGAGAPMTLPSNSGSVSGAAVPAPSAATITAAPVTSTRSPNSGKVALLILGLVGALLIGLVAVVGVGGVLWFGASEGDSQVTESAPVGASPVATPTEPQAEPQAEPPPPDEPVSPTEPHSAGAEEGTPHSNPATESPRAGPDAGAKPATKKAAYRAGQKVDVQWGGSWWQGRVLAVKNDKFLVHYIGWSSSWNEWVTTARLRPWTGSAKSK